MGGVIMKKDVANIKKRTIEKKRNIKYNYPYIINMRGNNIELKIFFVAFACSIPF